MNIRAREDPAPNTRDLSKKESFYLKVYDWDVIASERIRKAFKRRIEEQSLEFAKRVQPIYKLLDWHWTNGVPSVKEIQDTVIGLASSVFDNDNRFASTGGIRVGYEWDEYDEETNKAYLSPFVRMEIDSFIPGIEATVK